MLEESCEGSTRVSYSEIYGFVENSRVNRKIVRNERSFKPHIKVSPRLKKERTSKLKWLIVKTSSPAWRQRGEHANQCIHVAEDSLSDLQKMKRNRSKVFNNNMFEIDSCVLPQSSKDSTVDEKISIFLEKWLSRSTCYKSRKTMQDGKVILISRHALNHEKSTESH